MNYLAHCFLSCSEEDILIGNFMTDFLKKKEEANYQGRILDGIKLHREIDTYTDKHPKSLELRALLRPRHGKYAPVVVDLIWDYYLSKNWTDYSEVSLDEFNSEIYEKLARRKNDLPEKLKVKIDKMIDNQFLLAYASKENMAVSLKWMDKRVKYESNFIGAIKDIEENDALFQNMFSAFFIDLIRYTEQNCGC